MYQGKYVSAVKTKAARKRKKRISVGTVIFYFLYLLMIVAFALALRYAMGFINDWLVRFEASQPETKSQEVFDDLFADPDWGEIYDLAGFEDTLFESKEAYTAYMEAKVGDQELIYTKTSAGLTGGHKYIVKLGDEKLATFTLQNEVVGELEIPDWKLSTVEAFLSREEDVTILTQPGHQVAINGIPINEAYIVASTSTVVESYLPEGLHGDRTVTYYTDGLLMEPVVTITDENGNSLECYYDEITDTYCEVLPDSGEISDEEYNVVLNATKGYCKHMIGAAGAGLSNYFDTSSDLYDFINSNELWFRGYTGYYFSEETISDYHRYTEELFSARIKLTLNVKRSNGSIKEFDIDHTFFVRKNANGVWKVFEMTNVDVQKVLTEVKLTYKVNGEVVSSEMVSSESTTLTTPSVTVPEGKKFAGWFRETKDENGNPTLQLMFTPDANSKVTLPNGYVLEHMVLQARFENGEA